MQDVKKWFKRESGKKEKENKRELKKKNRFTKASRNADMNLLIEAKMASTDRSQ